MIRLGPSPARVYSRRLTSAFPLPRPIPRQRAMSLRPVILPLRRGLYLVIACLAGCASGDKSNGRKWYDPFSFFCNEKEGPKVKITTSQQRVKILRALAKQASTLPPEEQERATDELCQALSKENDILVRAEMLRCIAVFPSPRAEAMRVLCETLASDTDIDVRLAAARALGRLKDPQSVAALALALDDTNPAIQYRAMQSLKAVTGKNYQTIKDWREYAQGDKSEPPSLVARLRQLF